MWNRLQGLALSLSLKAALERTEREIIAAELKANNYNRQATAEKIT
ncbi:MAG: hypothetical protein GWP14_09800 [Actinobacteria bacterium]|nr:hypothetical protein [Actinomycetota bacterium]